MLRQDTHAVLDMGLSAGDVAAIEAGWKVPPTRALSALPQPDTTYTCTLCN